MWLNLAKLHKISPNYYNTPFRKIKNVIIYLTFNDINIHSLSPMILIYTLKLPHLDSKILPLIQRIPNL